MALWRKNFLAHGKIRPFIAALILLWAPLHCEMDVDDGEVVM